MPIDLYTFPVYTGGMATKRQILERLAGQANVEQKRLTELEDRLNYHPYLAESERELTARELARLRASLADSQDATIAVMKGKRETY